MRRFLFIIKMTLVAALAAGLLFVSGCQSSFNPNAFHIFYVNEKMTGLIPIEYELSSGSTEMQIDELLDVMSTETGRVDHIRPIPNSIQISKTTLVDGILKIYFGSSYSELGSVDEVLCRAAVVKTMVQLDGVDGVMFFVNEKSLTDSTGKAIGLMTNETFIDNPGEDIQNIQETELVLYFASADGKSLVKEVQQVHYSSNMSMEKVVIDRLLKNPKSENAQCAIPSGTQLINVSVLDGICVVNFDEAFLTHNYDISEEVVIYSIVDSLTELNTVKTVQISVNGETNRVYREKFSLSEQYKRNLDLVTEENDKVEVIDETQTGGVLSNITDITE